MSILLTVSDVLEGGPVSTVPTSTHILDGITFLGQIHSFNKSKSTRVRSPFGSSGTGDILDLDRHSKVRKDGRIPGWDLKTGSIVAVVDWVDNPCLYLQILHLYC